MARIHIHQIFYDDASRRLLDPAFIPLDNSGSDVPEWFEFAPMRTFFAEQKLDDGAWYGFLSPKFTSRTAVSPAQLLEFVSAVDSHADVVLASHGWDQIAFFLNPFEQGEFWHPELRGIAERFVAAAGVGLPVRSYVGHSMNTVYSNYVVAKPVFWRSWLEFANLLFELAEDPSHPLGKPLSSFAMYDTGTLRVPTKTFLQERLASLVLATKRFRVAVIDTSAQTALNANLFEENLRTRRLLGTCDTLKLECDLSGDRAFLDMFHKVRASIPTRRPILSRRPRS